jgi:hypothetical protein
MWGGGGSVTEHVPFWEKHINCTNRIHDSFSSDAAWEQKGI